MHFVLHQMVPLPYEATAGKPRDLVSNANPYIAMNENLKKAIRLYTTDDKNFVYFLQNQSKPTLISMLTDLLTMYFNDKNSSSLRELAALYITGYEPNQAKLGYNGYRFASDIGQNIYCEVKPKNTDNPRKKLDGGGSFNDYTPERFQKDLENNPRIFACGYVNGQLVYIFSFEFRCLASKIGSLLEKRFGSELVRKSGEYLRSASFSIADYQECPSTEVVFLSPKWEKYKKFLSKRVIEFIKSKSK